MPYFDFEVLHGDDVIVVEKLVSLESSRAVWPKVVDIARSLDGAGCRIRVREQAGGTIVLIGASAARRYPGLASSA